MIYSEKSIKLQDNGIFCLSLIFFILHQELLIGFASILVLGMTAQWVAWRLGLPSILLLLLFGFIAGPLTGFINPDKLFGEQLTSFVSIAVGIILFEGGLNLRISELKESGKTIFSLISIGALITWILGSFAAHYLLDIELPLAVLLGAILVVSGPTVVMPILRQIKPQAKISSILKWEGIMIDPIGAILAVLVFEVIVGGNFYKSTFESVFEIIYKTAFISSLIGFLGAGVFVLFLKRFWVPDYLQVPLSLMSVVGTFTVSNIIQPESGLLTVTIMGILLANQKLVSIKHIIHFKESLSIILISVLFILLASRLKPDDFFQLDITSIIFIAFIIFILRPLAVFVSTLNSNLKVKEKVFLAFMYPRGIIAAAVSSFFALRLKELGYVNADILVSYSFMVIISTVAFYGLLSSPLAKMLGLAKKNPQGVLMIGAHEPSQLMAKALHEEGIEVMLVDTNRENLNQAQALGLKTFYASILSEYALDEIDLANLGRVMALTSNDEVNSLTCINLS
ncbi:MAG TPA: cation:proton antiporter, partial [Vampirovibrionales bacterium]